MTELLQEVLTDQTKILFVIVVVILLLEMLSGVLKAIKNKNLNSTKFREGLLSKSGYFLQIALCLLVSIIIKMPYLLYADLIWISMSEGVSVLENIEQMGVPYPEFLRQILEKTKSKTEDEMKNEDEDKEK